MIASELRRIPYILNSEQEKIVSHKQGPLRVIAGPGSGKTRSLIFLAMNLLLCNDVRPSGIVLCTYTEKAAQEMQDRLFTLAQEVHYQGDLSEMKIGTIHSICTRFLQEHIHYTNLCSNFTTLDQLTQRLFITENIDSICSLRGKRFFQAYWNSDTSWSLAKKLQVYFDKITEELLYEKLVAAVKSLQAIHRTEREQFLSYLTYAYKAYQEALKQNNSLDFAHLQKCTYNLLTDPTTFPTVTRGIRYVLVDEYQDTNHIQERILSRLAEATGTNNICVVGDEDQAIYRFRGATVRNIHEFATKFQGCKTIHLVKNYRSHPDIIDLCNQWITSIDWSNATPGQSSFRTEKTIVSATRPSEHYPAVIAIEDVDVQVEAEQFADIVVSLREHKLISDYNQVALLLGSVRSHISGVFIEALKKKGIPVHCPRARTYFEQEEIQLLMGCFHYLITQSEPPQSGSMEHLPFIRYLDQCRKLFQRTFDTFLDLRNELNKIKREIALSEETDGKQLLEYFYRIIFTRAFEEFFTYGQNVRKRHNLAIFSHHLQTFQSYYQIDQITEANLATIAAKLFHQFFCFLYLDGTNEYEDPQMPLLREHVHVMTIHQAKGLEFPVVAVGRLDKASAPDDAHEKELFDFYKQLTPEPANRIPAFDFQRLYYVAFSRACQLLILTANKKPHKQFAPIWHRATAWEYASEQLRSTAFLINEGKHIAFKPRYSFTTHIQLYTTCPRQFEYFQQHGFTPTQPAEVFTGRLVHQTLERIHRLACDGHLNQINERSIQQIIEQNFLALQAKHPSTTHPEAREKASRYVFNYIQNNYADIQQNIEDTELDFRLEREKYMLTGKIDLIVRKANGLEIIDFKTRTRPENYEPSLKFYKQQLYLYAEALEKRKQQQPNRLLLYWLAEERKENAVMEIPYNHDDMLQIRSHFDDVVHRINQQKFHVTHPPDEAVCKTCTLRFLCKKQKIISLST